MVRRPCFSSRAHAKCRTLQGITKTYRLTYESIEVMHALFDKNAAKNKWTISASLLRSFIEYFGAATEQLDVYSENGRAQFTSYTEKIMDGKGPFPYLLVQI